MADRWAASQSRLARKFFLALLMQWSGCFLLAFLLVQLFSLAEFDAVRPGPTMLVCSSVILIFGSWLLHNARIQVSRERQTPFRMSLLLCVLIAPAFIGSQTVALFDAVRAVHSTGTSEVGSMTESFQQADVSGFVLLFVALHAMHFAIAQSVLLWVTLSAFQDRYDHEYYFGVTVTEWFWHALGIIWLAILAVMLPYLRY